MPLLIEQAPRRAGTARRPRVVRVAVAGCGVVGGELVRLLHARSDELERAGLAFRLVRVLVRDRHKRRPADLAPHLITTEVDDFLAVDADLVVETIGGFDPAARIVRSALERGARVVSANKRLLAEQGPELAALAQRRGSRLDFEAAVGGGIPIVRALRESLAGTAPSAIHGVLNGTSNYILTLLHEGVPFHEALSSAQANGFAEADPSRDLDGSDTAEKLALLAWLAYDVPPSVRRMRCRGILPDPERLVRDAESVGGVARLVASCRSADADGRISASVEPVIVGIDSELGRCRYEENRIIVELGWGRPLSFAGPGAGGGPTASAILGDLIAGCAAPLPAASARQIDADRGRHLWLVSVTRSRAAELERAAASSAFGWTSVDRTSGRVRLGPCAWDDVAAVASRLASSGDRPIITRLENDSVGGATP